MKTLTSDRVRSAFCVLHDTINPRGWIAWFWRELRARRPDDLGGVSEETVRRWLRPDHPSHTPLPAEAEAVAEEVIREARNRLVTRIKELGE